MKFNATMVHLDGSTIHHAFDEIRDSLCWALSSLGHTVSRTENWFSEHGETNIIFGTELIADWQKIPRNSIIFNLEQKSHPRMPGIRKLAQGLPVWDFSLSNVQEWQSLGFQCHHVPIGYTPNLTRIPSGTKDWDVLFYGWETPRRRQMIDMLTADKLKVFSASAHCYGGVRDNLISRSKVVLNVHHDGRDQFEIIRCSYLMANSACILTEPSSDDVDYEDLRHGLTITPYRLMVDICHSMVNCDHEREKQGSIAFGSIRVRDFAKAVASALEWTTFETGPSRPIVRAQERQQQKQEYLEQGRELSKNGHDPRVAARFERARQEGDMRDFSDYLRDNAKGSILEIGVRDGASTSAFLAGIEDGKGFLDSIDIVNCDLFHGHHSWQFHKLDSKYAVFPYSHFDLILIDGDHSREGFKTDLGNSWNWIKPGGKILCHDITPERTCEEFGGDWPSIAVGEEYRAFCERTGCRHEELAGYSGMGVIYKNND